MRQIVYLPELGKGPVELGAATLLIDVGVNLATHIVRASRVGEAGEVGLSALVCCGLR